MLTRSEPGFGNSNSSHRCAIQLLHGTLRKYAYRFGTWNGTQCIFHIPSCRFSRPRSCSLSLGTNSGIRRRLNLRLPFYIWSATMACSSNPIKSEDCQWCRHRALPRSYRTHLQRGNWCNHRQHQRPIRTRRLQTLSYRHRWNL